MKLLKAFVISLAVLSPLAANAMWLDHGAASGLVTRVFDGDTILVKIGGIEEKVRLLGIDCPEKNGPYTSLEPFGNEAWKRTEELALGKRVRLVYGGESLRDKYNRLLAHVILPDGRVLNEILLSEGLAVHYRKFKYTHKKRYMAIEAEARRACRGLWSRKRHCGG